jgi:Rrf2 family protein
MLKLNRETDYAIRVILALAKYPPGSIIPSQSIRDEMNLPEALSIQIISHLAHQNILKTYPGRKGGIQLAISPEKVTLHDIVEIMEGPIILSECLEEDHHCDLSPSCPVQKRWIKLQFKVVKELREINFQDLIKDTPHISNLDVK